MSVYYSDDLVTLHHGDCVEVMRELPDNSVDSVVTDPPYGLEFMGKDWDKFRLDDPGTNRNRGDRAGEQGRAGTESRGAFGRVAYGGGKHPRTSRCSSCGKRDQFRNPHDCDGTWISEVINPNTAPPTSIAFQNWFQTIALEAYRVLKPGGHLLAFGGTRTWHRLAVAIEDAGFEVRDSIAWMYASGFPKSLDVSKAIDKRAGAEREVVGTAKGVGVSPEDNQHGGINRGAVGIKQSAIDVPITAPATPAAQQWQGWGTALKPAFEPIVVARKPLDGTVAENVLRWGTGALNIDDSRISYASEADKDQALAGDAFKRKDTSDKGWSRPWMEDAERVAQMNAEAKQRAQSGRWPANVILDESQAAELDKQAEEHPARFFYVPKANASERPRDGDTAHPTVKPLDLMRYLVKLVTPPGGTVLEPFAGSGTTLEACVIEGFAAIGIELTEDYLPLIVQRVTKPTQQVLL